MQSVRNALTFVLALLSLHRLSGILHRWGHQASVQVTDQPDAKPTSLPDTATIDDEDASGDDTDVEDQFANWDTDRADKLHQAEECEKKGLALLAKAALLRLAIKCDSRGETFIADELREHAQTLDGEYVDALSAEETWEPATIRFETTDSGSTKRGA